ncbi:MULTISPECIES: hypothetical protein [unclassified Sphingomonas]|uniref:hypothetical protein n=1 Tax=unclassified Sphingomonas TaxID=196159 RepID=UPI002150DA0C|nr:MULTISPECIES: hypothetical protein [unclassified Sphingomonas]MCR5871117.1 hypothetical protein [Sphingomonas sp. J344]UUY00568.1 hypothetical protein LRS08_05640 [Sphingomonas sp. J315]
MQDRNRADRRIAIITYDARHLKTEQLAIGLDQAGYRNLVFYALPFVSRPSREILFAHRPDMLGGSATPAMAEYLGAEFVAVSGAQDIPADGADLFLIAGAGILPEAFVRATRGRVLNCHPGIIPLVRGLDSV